jgi:tetratricopeptide (TPR) repeat protein
LAAADTQRATPVALQPAVLNPAIRELFEQLAADDPKLRDDATQRLVNYGPLIRPALLQASRHAQPLELRFRAARVLCQMPWTTPQDPPAVQSVLQEYRSPQPEVRAAVVRRMGAVVGEPAFDALLRLLAEEPGDDVRWTIVQQLRGFTAPALRSRLRGELQQNAAAADDDLPNLAAQAWGWQSTDPERAAVLFRRCADLAAARGDATDDQGEIALILRLLVVRATNRGERDPGAELTRRLVLMGAEPPLELFVFHAQHGPCRGLEQDICLAPDGLFDTAEGLYVLGHIHARRNEPLLAIACYRSAGLAALSSQEAHERVAAFLLKNQWYELAEVEFQAAIATPGADKAEHDADAFVGLALCATGRGDDAAAAEHLATVMQLVKNIPGRDLAHAAQFHAELDWHALRAARARGDWTGVAERAESLLNFERAAQAAANNNNNNDNAGQHQQRYTSPMYGEMAIDLISSLKHLGRSADAAPIFQHFFDYCRAELDADPHGADPLNNLAWLCARCGEHIDQAVAWSTEAIHLAPANAAYLDTAAEAAAQQGRWQDAAQLESAALKLQPGDRFMLSQLDRFKNELRNSKPK